jgi:hypothetical protein
MAVRALAPLLSESLAAAVRTDDFSRLVLAPAALRLDAVHGRAGQHRRRRACSL